MMMMAFDDGAVFGWYPCIVESRVPIPGGFRLWLATQVDAITDQPWCDRWLLRCNTSMHLKIGEWNCVPLAH